MCSSLSLMTSIIYDLVTMLMPVVTLASEQLERVTLETCQLFSVRSSRKSESQ